MTLSKKVYIRKNTLFEYIYKKLYEDNFWDLYFM